LAGAEIEPDEQSALLDRTRAALGDAVVLAGVPGAGGYDAVCVLARDDAAADELARVWAQWLAEGTAAVTLMPTTHDTVGIVIEYAPRACT